jgi:hypothetical protein
MSERDALFHARVFPFVIPGVKRVSALASTGRPSRHV